MDVLKETNSGNLGQKKVGKVRDIYDQGDKLILIATDRHSSFDRIVAHIPWKGQVLNQVSAWWFEQTKAIVSNQVLAVPDPNVTVARKYKIVPVEAVMRGYLTGVTDTSIWSRYQKGIRQFDDLNLLAKYFPGQAPDYVSLEGYVDANVLIAALQRSGLQLDTEKLVSTLENLRDLDIGLGTPVTFSRSDHQGVHKVWGTQLDETGHYQPIDLQ
jgi:SAICAR synthetase/Periplasmic binding protein